MVMNRYQAPSPDRKQKFLTPRGEVVAGVALTALTAAGIVAVASSESGTSNSVETDNVQTTSETVHVSGTVKGSEDNWGHDTAKNILLYGAGKATAAAIAELNPEDSTTTPSDIVDMIKNQDTYDKVSAMLEQAAEAGQLPQPGDIISSDITATVTEVSSNNGEYNYTVDFSADNTEYSPAE